MGLEIIGAIVAVVGTVSSVMSQQEAKKNASSSAAASRRSQEEQRAVQARQASEEKRKMVREERVRRAKILQSSENTGVAGSSGEVGALGSIATQFSANQGSNIGAARSGSLIGGFAQDAANENYSANKNMQEGAQWAQFGTIGSNIFDAAGGFQASNKSTSDPFADFYLKGNRGTGD